jgi:Na+/glutamate symporter
MVRTPVGLRCPDCAGVRGLPTYRTPAQTLLKATAAGLLVALVTAILWRQGPTWGFYLSLLLGFGSVEAMARIANNKRGFDLQIAAMAVVTFGLVLSRILLAQRFGVTWDDLNNLNGQLATPELLETYGFRYYTVTEVLRLRFIPDILCMAMAYAIAWFRFR